MPKLQLPHRIVDSTNPEYRHLVGPTERDCALWFDNAGCGPDVVDWTVRVMPEIDPDNAHVGIEFHRLGGPFMTIQTAERLHAALGKAIEMAKRPVV